MSSSRKRFDPDLYLGWDPAVVFRGLETPHLFHLRQDELYELDPDGLAFLEEVDGTRRVREIRNRKLLAFCRKEDLLAFSSQPRPRALWRGAAPHPSLRYLEVQLTGRCNLACRHCYLGPARAVDLKRAELFSLLEQFDRLQGLRLLLSGGEPLLYPAFAELNERLPDYSFRSVLLTNGLLLKPSLAKKLRLHEVQVSLDGMRDGHEALRGRGSFARAKAGARAVAEAGLDLSIATMAHGRNLDEFAALKKLVQELGAREWSVDVPGAAGRFARPGKLAITAEQGAAAMRHAFGGSYHGSSRGFACGRHLATVMPSGAVLPCGFFPETPLGHLAEGLAECWSRRRHLRVSELECGRCEARDQCAGGCRFRAGGVGKDPVMCAVYGQNRIERAGSSARI